ALVPPAKRLDGMVGEWDRRRWEPELRTPVRGSHRAPRGPGAGHSAGGARGENVLLRPRELNHQTWSQPRSVVRSAKMGALKTNRRLFDFVLGILDGDFLMAA